MSKSARRQYGEGNISPYKVKGGERYRVQWYEPVDLDDEGSPKTRKQRAGFETKKAAATFLRERLSELDRGIPSTDRGRKITFGEFLTQWLEGHRVGASTKSSYRRLARLHVIPNIGHLPLVKVTPPVLAGLYRQLETSGSQKRGKEGEPLSPNSVLKVHQLISVAMKDALEQGLVRSNPAQMSAAKPPTPTEVKEARKEMVVWDRHQLNQFLLWARDNVPDLYPAWLLIARTGVRRGEALGLRWGDVDLKSGVLTFRRSIVSVKNYGEPTERVVKGTKSSKVRTMRIDSVLVAELRALRTSLARLDMSKVHRDAPVIILGHGRSPNPDYLTGRWVTDVRRFVAQHPDVPYINLHALRHTHATHLLDAGVRPKVVQKRLGHETFAITMDLYSHVMQDAEDEAVDLFESYSAGFDTGDAGAQRAD